MGTEGEGKASRTAKIWDRFAEGYSKSPIGDEAAYQKKLQVTRQYLRPDMNLVELGCGTGGTSIIHAPSVKRILATDISPKMLEIAKKKAEDANVKNIEFRVSSVEQLELPSGSQDAVLGMSILHLLENRDAAIAKTHQWLKPGGLFVTSTICIGDMGMVTNLLMKMALPIGQFFGFLPTVNSFTKSELKDSLKRAGFGIEHEWQPKEGAAVFIIGKKI